MEDAPQHVRIGDADEQQRVELDVAANDVREQRRELVRADLERDADARELLLQDGRLHAIALDRRRLQRQAKARRRTGSVRIAKPGLVEQGLRASRDRA